MPFAQTTHRQHRSRGDEGWVIVPVLALLVVALGLGFALLAVVDTQTSQGRVQRDVDAAQTLAEGVAASTATVLGSDQSGTAWPVAGPCRSYTHFLADTSTGSDLEARIVNEVHSRFAGSSSDLDDVDVRRTSWTVNVCPVQGASTSATTWDQQAEDQWANGFLTRTVAVPLGTGGTAIPNGPTRVSLWVRGQANIRSATTTAGAPTPKSRAVVSKIKQSATSFAPPSGYALGTGSISTDLQSGLSTTLLNNDALTGKLLGSTLGAKSLIGDSAKIGTRCGLLNATNSLNSVCLSGSLAGAASATKSLSVGQLNTLLGVNNQTTLGTWTMASPDAISAYRRDAQRTGIYKATVPGVGDDRTKSAPTPTPAGSADCLSASELAASSAATVVFIDKVGNGEQYCTLPGGTAKIFVVARGGVRITDKFTGVVYGLNLQECSATDGTCSTADRTGATRREVVRIEGNTGRVVGSVWADGAGGQVGIYPSLASPSSGALIKVGDAQQGICGIPVLGPVLQGLSTTLGGIFNAVGNLLGGLLGSQEQVRYVDANDNVLSTPPSNCDFLRNSLGALTSSSLLNLMGTGGSQSVVLTERRTRSCFLGNCGAWSDWSARDTVTFSIPALLTSGLPTVLGDVVGLLTSTLSQYQAITYDASVTSSASTAVTSSAGPVVGSYRNVAAVGVF